MRHFWPIAEAAQADYEKLRQFVIVGNPPIGESAVRFERKGLAGLILHPVSESCFEAQLVGARRPAWSPYADPRFETLGASYELLLVTAVHELPLLREIR